MNEDIIKKSFENVKKDMSEIKNQLSQLTSLLSPDLRQNSRKIFTSKPFVDDSMLEAIKEVLDSGFFTGGPKLKDFEEKFAKFTGSKHAIALTNGTVAIEIVLKSLGIKEGDEIIVPSFTTMPTIEPILNLDAIPVFVDIDENTYTLDPRKVEKAITKKTKAILPVHIYGHPADIVKLKNICEKKKIYLIEDCAQAHNAKVNEKHVGTFGVAGCFSFYPTKNLTVLGEGGMIITDDDKINEMARMLINHGEKIGERYNHEIVGTNYRLGELHCALGIKQLELLEKFTQRRREIAKLYKEKLKNAPLILPKERVNARHSYHLFVIRVDKNKRDSIIKKMKDEGIYCGIHYPIPCHKQKAVTNKFKTPSLPITEKLSNEIISLPIYPELSDSEVNLISGKLLRFISL